MKLIFFVLCVLLSTTAHTKNDVKSALSEISICRIEKVVWSEKRQALIYFGRTSSGSGIVLKPNTDKQDISNEDVDRRFRIDDPNVLWWDDKTNTYHSPISYLEINQGIRVSWSGYHSSCSITWEIIDGELQLVISTVDTSVPAGIRPKLIRQSTKIPK